MEIRKQRTMSSGPVLSCTSTLRIVILPTSKGLRKHGPRHIVGMKPSALLVTGRIPSRRASVKPTGTM